MLLGKAAAQRPGAWRYASCQRKQYFYTANGFRPRPVQTSLASSRRKASFEAGEDDTGHISTGRNEGMLFFDSTAYSY